MEEFERALAALLESPRVNAAISRMVREAVRAELTLQTGEMLDAKGAAKLLSLSVGAVRARVARGQIPCTRIGRSLRFRRIDLMAVEQAGDWSRR